jgi:threonine dehydratase
MSKFTVKFRATTRFEAEIEVEANSYEEAEEIALNHCEDEGYDWVPDNDYWKQELVSSIIKYPNE